jgi:hypothetical protein
VDYGVDGEGMLETQHKRNSGDDSARKLTSLRGDG